MAAEAKIAEVFPVQPWDDLSGHPKKPEFLVYRPDYCCTDLSAYFITL